MDDTSLAAESLRSGGTFSENRGTTASQYRPGSENSGPESDATKLENQDSYGGQTASYVTSQYRRDPKGPHGKNLQEGGFEGSGPGSSIEVEAGSFQDPARKAEQDMKLAQSKAGRDAGPRQAGWSQDQRYGSLNNDESA